MLHRRRCHRRRGGTTRRGFCGDRQHSRGHELLRLRGHAAISDSGFHFQSYGDVTDLESYIAYLNSCYESGNFNLEIVGESSVVEGAETYIVAEPGLVTADGYPGLRGFSMYTLVESDGTWLTQQTRWISANLCRRHPADENAAHPVNRSTYALSQLGVTTRCFARQCRMRRRRVCL